MTTMLMTMKDFIRAPVAAALGGDSRAPGARGAIVGRARGSACVSRVVSRATRRAAVAVDGVRRRGRVISMGYSMDPNALPTFGGTPGQPGANGGMPGAKKSATPPKPPGGGLIMPGMDEFDDSVVTRNPLSGGSTSSPGGRGPTLTHDGSMADPSKPIPKVGGELSGAFEPYKPPPTFDAAKADETDPERMLMMLRGRVGLWHTLAKYIRPLQQRGYQPNDLFDATGIEPKEQAQWMTWLACYASLKESPKFADEKLEYFSDEYVGAPNLSQIMYLPSAVRVSAAEFIVDNEFEETQSRELVKAYEIRKANASTVVARSFNETPGDILAFKLYRDIQELQRYQGEEEAKRLFDKGSKYAVTETAKERLKSAFDLYVSQINGPASVGLSAGVAGASSASEEEFEAAVQVVRLEEAEMAYRAIPVLGSLSKITSAKIKTAGTLERTGDIFGVFKPSGNSDWVALPNWDLLVDSGEPFAMYCDDTSKLDVGGIKDKSEPALLIADRKSTTPSMGRYYLVGKKSSLVMAGSGGNAETVEIMNGKDILAAERNGKSLNTLARIVLAVRAPSRGDDGMTTEFVS